MMWTHYAKKHRGVCLVFDREAFERQLRARFGADLLTDKVRYTTLNAPRAWTPILDASEVHKKGEAVAAEDFFVANKHEPLFIKNQDWSVEREWRVAIDNQPTGEIEAYLTPGIIAGLVVGLSLPKGNLTMVKTVATAFGIADHVARAYQHQLNVVDVVPLDTSGTMWRDYTLSQLRGLGYA